jgi:hypothetical protein
MLRLLSGSDGHVVVLFGRVCCLYLLFCLLFFLWFPFLFSLLLLVLYVIFVFCLLSSLQQRAALRAEGWILRDVVPVGEFAKGPTHWRWQHAMTKLRLWELTDWDKIVFVDADFVFLKNPDRLFDVRVCACLVVNFTFVMRSFFFLYYRLLFIIILIRISCFSHVLFIVIIFNSPLIFVTIFHSHVLHLYHCNSHSYSFIYNSHLFFHRHHFNSHHLFLSSF